MLSIWVQNTPRLSGQSLTAARDGGTANPATSPATGACPVIDGATTWSNTVAYRFGGTWA
jgi:hypothetical protein